MPILSRALGVADSTPQAPHAAPTADLTAPTGPITSSTLSHNPAYEYFSWVLHSPVGAATAVAGALAIVSLFHPPTRKAVAPLWRLLTGGLVFVTPGAWDSQFTRPAPERPENQPLYRGERFPKTRWAKAPGYVRMLIRWAGAAYAAALYAVPWPALGATVVAAVVVVARRVLREARDFVFGRALGTFVQGAQTALGEDRPAPEWVAAPKAQLTWYPLVVAPAVLRLARKVSERLEHQLGRLAVPAFRIPLEEDDARVLVRLDAQMINKGVVEEVKRLGVARIPEGPWKADHKESQLTIVFRHVQRPPARVVYDDEAFQRFGVADVPIGKKAGGAWVKLPLKELAPHAVMSATTGWGKTVTANVYIAHTAGNGGRVFINDPKRVGFIQAFGGLDNVVIRTTAEGWQESVAEFLEEMERRYELIEQFPELKENPELYFQPWFLVTDERGSYISDLRDLAKAQGEKGMPLVFRQEKKILWQARAAGMYMFDLAQQANLQVFLDSDGRDQRMCRLAAGPQTRSSWVMLFPGSAKKSVALRKGRAMFTIGVDDPEEIQLAYIDDATARAYAMAGVGLAEMENEDRKRRIADLIASAVACVPAQEEATLSGKIDGSVPVLSRYTGTQPQDAPPVDFTKDGKSAGESGNANVYQINDEVEVPAQGVYLNAPEHSEIASGSNADADGPRAETIMGTAAAAEFLGMSENSFIVARKRRPIPGEKRAGNSPHWTPLVLREWRSQAPRAGAS